ncbi:hypothetical protein [uncultured Alistipes sp.]|jgi:membrane protein|nr:hypothetical protein [uncultured Alistipes sp.]
MRQVSVVWLVVLAALCVAIGWDTAGIKPLLLHTAVNLGLLLFLGGTMTVWQLMRRRSLREFFSTCFGAGDVVMMAVIAPLFAPLPYVRLLLAACAAALVWWLVKRPANIPLAGFIALILTGYAICKTTGIWS